MLHRRTAIALVACVLPILAQSGDLSEELFAAARRGDAARVQELLDKGVPVDAQWRYGTTALLMASRNGHSAVVKILIERGANVNVKDTFYGLTPLSAAAGKGSAEIVRMLLAKGAAGKDGALLNAVVSNNLDVATAVLESAGLKPDTLSEALARAMMNKREDIVAALKAAGAVEPPKADYAVDHETLKKYAGTYQTPSGPDIVLEFKDNKLIATAPFQNIVMNAFDNTTFRPGDFLGMKVTFLLEGDKVTGLSLDQRGTIQTYKRVEAGR